MWGVDLSFSENARQNNEAAKGRSDFQRSQDFTLATENCERESSNKKTHVDCEANGATNLSVQECNVDAEPTGLTNSAPENQNVPDFGSPKMEPCPASSIKDLPNDTASVHDDTIEFYAAYKTKEDSHTLSKARKKTFIDLGTTVASNSSDKNERNVREHFHWSWKLKFGEGYLQCRVRGDAGCRILIQPSSGMSPSRRSLFAIDFTSDGTWSPVTDHRLQSSHSSSRAMDQRNMQCKRRCSLKDRVQRGNQFKDSNDFISNVRKSTCLWMVCWDFQLAAGTVSVACGTGSDIFTNLNFEGTLNLLPWGHAKFESSLAPRHNESMHDRGGRENATASRISKDNTLNIGFMKHQIMPESAQTCIIDQIHFVSSSICAPRFDFEHILQV